jgi:ferredoxin, 2Fe-2S
MSKLTVTFVEEDGTVKTLSAETGQSLMQVGKDAGVEGILADCAGSCACATCHVYVDDEWYPTVGAPDAVEAEMLDMVDDVRKANSRLSCQIKLTAALNGLRVTVAPLG